jgi:hypothetical protein
MAVIDNSLQMNISIELSFLESSCIRFAGRTLLSCCDSIFFRIVAAEFIGYVKEILGQYAINGRLFEADLINEKYQGDNLLRIFGFLLRGVELVHFDNPGAEAYADSYANIFWGR